MRSAAIRALFLTTIPPVEVDSHLTRVLRFDGVSLKILRMLSPVYWVNGESLRASLIPLNMLVHIWDKQVTPLHGRALLTTEIAAC